ncbi:MAG: chemotaxis protein CheA [Deltaproteobacteria bacterium]|nr:chemotaxis protein CheA [Deltaproteobacteria bacterium]
MAPDPQEFASHLERLALKAVMLAEDDVPALGAFLNDLDALSDKLASAPEAAALVRQLSEAGNRLVLGEIQAPSRAVEFLGLGITLLQQWIQQGNWSQSGEEFQNYCRLSEELGLGIPAAVEAFSDPERGAAQFLDDPELLANFLTESREHLEGIETRLVYLEQNPGELSAINAIFRPFHTIKGVAGFLNLQQVQELSHEVESLLEEVRGGRLEVTSELVDAVLAGVDLLRRLLEEVEAALADTRELQSFDLAPLKERLQALRHTSAAPPRLGEILVDQGVLTPEEVNESLKDQDRREPHQPLGEILVGEGKAPAQSVAQALVQQMALARRGGEAAAPATIKVDLAKVDLLVDLMGELVIIQSQVRQNPAMAAAADQKLVRDLGQMARITSDLQRIAMSLRMVPIGATFRKMVRLVRDLSHKTGKLVSLHLEGEDTEIDRNMVETIYDPLVHLIRNAVDHGLEPPEERQAQGKAAKGELWLRAYQKGGSIVIEIEDDGRGLNREAILKRARERSLVAAGESLSPAQIDNLIFEPGFSTAKELTEVSGRGVGMDVVKQTIEHLRGKIETSSQPGKGTCFTLRLPLTLAIIDGLVIRVNDEHYILPAAGVRETVKLEARDCFTVTGRGELIRVRDQLFPLVRLHHLFGAGNGGGSPAESLALLVEHEGENRALLVDEILGKQEVVIKSLGPLFQSASGLAGATILGDGRVGLILELGGIFHLQHSQMLPGNTNLQEKQL